MGPETLEERIRARTGLDPCLHGPRVLAQALARGRAALGEADEAAFRARCLREEAAFEACLEELVVLESWFFREPGAFACLGALADSLRAGSPAAPLRLLSLPCATGEEPYSMAIALLEAGLSPEGFRIDAVDLSGRALGLARRGRYGARSFRGTDPAALRRYLRPAEGQREVERRARDPVAFARGNLLDPACLREAAPYDVIFCRNLLIYLHPGARPLALTRLLSLLRPGGYLFLGAAEHAQGLSLPLEPAGPERSFAFRRRAGAGARA